jgi:hypothetical protein
MFVFLQMGVSAYANGPLPADTTERVGRAQTFTYGIRDLSVLRGTRDVIWNGPELASRKIIDPRIFNSYYVTSDRYFGANAAENGTAHPLSWYQANYPQCIVYTPKREPAWEFEQTAIVPWAIWRNDCRRLFLTLFVGPLFPNAYFQAMSADNVAVDNVFDRAGVYDLDQRTTVVAATGAPSGTSCLPVENSSGIAPGNRIIVSDLSLGKVYYMGEVGRFSCAAGSVAIMPRMNYAAPLRARVWSAGWNQRYEHCISVPCPRVDAQLVADWAAWLRMLRRYLNDLSPPKSLIINLSIKLDNLSGAAEIATHADMIYDEGAFQGNNTNDCMPGGRGRLVGQNWLRKAEWYVAGQYSFIQAGATCTDRAHAQPLVEWNTASYLLTKTSHSYLHLCYNAGRSGDQCKSEFEDYSQLLYLDHGPADGPMRRDGGGCYVRTFGNSRVIAALNPAIDRRCTLNLVGYYHDAGGEEFHSSVQLGPTEAHVLVKQH